MPAAPKLPEPEPPALTVNEAARIAGVSREAIIKWYNEGILKGYRRGIKSNSPIMIYLDSFSKFMQARKK